MCYNVPPFQLEVAMTDKLDNSSLNSVLGEVLTDSERQRCEVWTRVMGYHRPVASFNMGKKSEHRERSHFQECRCKLD